MFRLRTLGGVVLEGESGPISGRSSLRRRLALLALLASARDRGMPRDKLLAYLWPERDAEHGRHSLSQLLHAIRRDLGADAITVGVDDLRLNPACVWTDIGAFEDAIALGRLDDAIAVYGGPFLDGFFLSDALEFERWAEDERVRLANDYAAALDAVARAASASGDPQKAVKTWRRRLALDPLNSRVTLELMQALAAAGDRSGAIQQARLHANLLDQELGVAPDANVSGLAERLRKDTTADLVAAEVRTPTKISSDPVALLETGDSNQSPMVESQTPERDALSLGVAASRNRESAPARVSWASQFTPLLKGPRRWIAAAVLVAGVLIVITSPPVQHAFGSSRRTPRTVLMGAVSGTDRALALAVGEALRAELEAAPGLRVASQSRTREALRLMKVEPGTPITDSLASEVAARLGAPFAVTATAEPLGAGAEIVARLLDPRDGATIGTLSAHPATADEIVPAVTRLAEALRERALDMQVPDSFPALPAVTTTSISALRDYALARQAIARGDNERAISYAEAAVVEDSAFALAHYLLGDILWYTDHQRRSDEHIERAFALSDRLPSRERLIVRARYEQLVRDQPDSALQYWKLLRATYPDEPRAYEGMAWAYTALGRASMADAVADTAFQLDSTVGPRGFRGHVGHLIAVGDTTGAIAFARSKGLLFGTLYSLAFARRDWTGALRLLDSATRFGLHPGPAGALRQVAYLALGRLADGEQALNDVRADPQVQYLPRALLLQARAEAVEGSKHRASELTREALVWLEEADLSPPAYARLAERIADAAARAGDPGSIGAVRQLILGKDAGRHLRSYALSLLTIDACAAYARGDMRTAISLAERTRGPMFYGRAMSILLALEADAYAALGERERAATVNRMLLNPPSSLLDGDSETFEVVRRMAARELASRS